MFARTQLLSQNEWMLFYSQYDKSFNHLFYIFKFVTPFGYQNFQFGHVWIFFLHNSLCYAFVFRFITLKPIPVSAAFFSPFLSYYYSSQICALTIHCARPVYILPIIRLPFGDCSFIGINLIFLIIQISFLFFFFSRFSLTLNLKFSHCCGLVHMPAFWGGCFLFYQLSFEFEAVHPF